MTIEVPIDDLVASERFDTRKPGEPKRKRQIPIDDLMGMRRADEVEPISLVSADPELNPAVLQEKALFSEGIYDVPDNVKDVWSSRGPIGFAEQMSREDKSEMIPFNPEGAARSIHLYDAVQRLRGEKAYEEFYDRPIQIAAEKALGVGLREGFEARAAVADRVQVERISAAEQRQIDEELVRNFLLRTEEERIRGFTIGGNIARGVAALPAYMGEFILTGGLAAGGRFAVRKGIQKVIEGGIRAAAKTAPRRLAARIVGGSAQATVRTLVTPQRSIGGYAEKRVELGLEMTEKGRGISGDIEEAPITTWFKSIGNVWIEMFSETAGGEIIRAFRAAGGAVPVALKRTLEKIYLRMGKAAPKGEVAEVAGEVARDVKDLWTKAGWNGFLAELGEEGLGDVMRAFSGVEDFGVEAKGRAGYNPYYIFDKLTAAIVDGEKWLTTAGVLAFPGAARLGLIQSAELIDQRKREAGIPDPEHEVLTDAQVEGIVQKLTAPEIPISERPLAEEVRRAIGETPERVELEPLPEDQLELLRLAEEQIAVPILSDALQEQLEALGPEAFTTVESAISEYQAALERGEEPVEALRGVLSAGGITLEDITLQKLVGEIQVAEEAAQRIATARVGQQEIVADITEQIAALEAPVGVAEADLETFRSLAAQNMAAFVVRQAERQGISAREYWEKNRTRLLRGEDPEAQALLKREGLPRLDQPGALLERAALTVTGEAIPSPGLATEIERASPAVRAEFTRKSVKIIQDLGSFLGAEIEIGEGTGGYGGQINPNIIASVEPTSNEAADKLKVQRIARSIQYIFKQNAVPWFQAFPEEKGKKLRGDQAYLITFTEDLTPENEERFFAMLRQVLTDGAGYTKLNDTEIVVVNYGDYSQEQFTEGLDRLEREHGKEIGIEKAERFGSEGEYGPDLSEEAKTKGEKAWDVLLSDPAFKGSPAIQEGLRDRRARFDSLLKQFSGPALQQREQALIRREPLFQAARREGEPIPPRGFFIPSERVIAAFNSADATTFIHEPAHDWLEDMFGFIQSGQADELTIQDWGILKNWLGWREGQTSITTQQHERWANGVLVFYSEGQAPSEELRPVFERFREWIIQVYNNISAQLGVEISPEIRQVMANFISTQEQQRRARFLAAGPIGEQVSVAEIERELERNLTLSLQIRERQEQLGVGGEPGVEIDRIEARVAELEEALAVRKRVAAQVSPAEGPTVSQFAALREALRKQAQGAREAAVMTREEVRDVQNQLRQLIQQSALEQQDKAKFLATLGRIQTQEQLASELPNVEFRIQVLIERSAKRRSFQAIRKELKKIQPRKQAGRLVGKYTPIIHDILSKMRKAEKLTAVEAQARLDENLSRGDTGTSVPDMTTALENMMLNAVANTDERTAEELAELLRIIKWLKAGGREAEKVKQLREQADLDQNRDISEAAINSGSEGRLKTPGTENADDAITGWYYRATVGYIGWNDKMNRMSWNDKSTATNQSILNRLADVSVQETAEKKGTRINKRKVFRLYRSIFGEMTNFEMNKRWAAEGVRKSLGKFTNKRGEEITMLYSKGEARTAWMQLQQPSLQDTFFNEKGMAWTNEMGQALINSLTAQDIAFARGLLAFYGPYWNGFNDIYSDMNGVNLPQVENYSPIRRDKKEREVFESELLDEVTHRRSITPAAGKARLKNLHPLKRENDIDVVQRHIIQIEHYKAWAKKIRMLNSIFNYGPTRKAIEEIHGREFMRLIDLDIEAFTRGGIDRTHENKTLNTLKSNFVISTLAGKPSIYAKQIVSFIALADSIPVADFIAGLKDFTKDTRKKATILATSEVLRSRGYGFSPEMSEAMKLNSWTNMKLNPSFIQWMITNVRWGDRGAIYMGGWPVYRYHREVLKKPHSEAMKAFEDSFTTSQQSADLSQQSAWQKGGSFQRLFTVFASTPNQYVRKEMMATEDYYHGRISLKQWVKMMTIYHVMLPMLFQWVADGFDFEFKNQIRAGILGNVNGLFLWGQFFYIATSQALGVKAWSQDTILAAIFREFSQAMGAITVEDWDMESVLNAVKQGVEVAGLITALPAKQAINIIEGTHQMLDAENGEEMLKGFKRIAGWSEWVLNQGENPKSKRKFRAR